MRERIEQVCDRIIEEKRWRPFKDREILISKGGFPIAASIGLNDRRIRLAFSDQFETLVGAMICRHNLRINLDSAIETIVYHLFVHEYNHHHYCPGNVHLFQEILDGIRKAIEKREIRESRIKQVSFEIHNMFSDTVINTIESRSEPSARYRTGQDLSHLLALFYAHSGLLAGRTDKAMVLFLESNRYLCGTSDEFRQKSKPYFPLLFRDESQTVQDMVGVFLNEPSLVERTLARSLLDQDRSEIVRCMCDYPSWSVKAEQYARIIHPYLKQQHEWLENNFTGKSGGRSSGQREGTDIAGPNQEGSAEQESFVQSAAPGSFVRDEQPPSQERTNTNSETRGHRGEWSPANELPRLNGQQVSLEQAPPSSQGQDQFSPDPCYSPGAGQGAAAADAAGDGFNYIFEQADGTDPPTNAKAVVVEEATGQGKPVQKVVRQPSRGRLAGLGTGRFRPNMLNYEQLDRLYEERAGRIRLLDDDGGTNSLEVLRGMEDSDLSNLSRVHLPASVVVRAPDGRTYLSLRQRGFPISIDASVHDNIGGLPDLCFVFDSSGSMGFDPYRGEGEYDIAVLTFYSILRGLDTKGIAPLLKYNALNFSDVTFASGWQSYWNLQTVKRVLLQHQGGGTTIDVSTLSTLRNERKDNYLLFLLSDLAITNIGTLEQELIHTHLSRAASVLVFKLGGKTLLCERLENAGISVLYPRTAEDFMYGSIKIARETFAL